MRNENLNPKRALRQRSDLSHPSLAPLFTPSAPTFLTWRLHGSRPKNRSFPSPITSGQAFVAMDRILDNARTGPLYLRQPEIAAMAVEAILYRQACVEHLPTARICRHGEPRPSTHHSTRGSLPAQAVPRKVHRTEGKPDAWPHWSAVLAGRELRAPRPRPNGVPADRTLYRDESGESGIPSRRIFRAPGLGPIANRPAGYQPAPQVQGIGTNPAGFSLCRL